MRKPLLFIIPLIILGIAGCKKLDNGNSLNLTNDDAANLIGTSLSSSSGGVIMISSDIALSSQTLYSNNTGCGITKVDSIIHSTTTATVSYNYKLKYTNKLTCNANNQADNVTSSSTYTGSYSGPNLSTSSSSTANFVIAGLVPGSSVYAINGEFKGTGSFKLKSDTTRNGTINVDIVVKNVLITKATATTPAGITGGTATATITGTTAKHGAFSFSGALVFNGSSSATLTINSAVYTINLLTGAVTK